MSPASLWRQKANELLADGQWHDYDRTLAQIARVVPPGVAYRQNELDREVNRRARHARKPPDPARVGTGLGGYATQEERIRSGARTKARDVLRNPAFERDVERNLIRLRPTPTDATEPMLLRAAVDRLREQVDAAPRADAAAKAGLHRGTIKNFLRTPDQVSAAAIEALARVFGVRLEVHAVSVATGVCRTCGARRLHHIEYRNKRRLPRRNEHG